MHCRGSKNLNPTLRYSATSSFAKATARRVCARNPRDIARNRMSAMQRETLGRTKRALDSSSSRPSVRKLLLVFAVSPSRPIAGSFFSVPGDHGVLARSRRYFPCANCANSFARLFRYSANRCCSSGGSSPWRLLPLVSSSWARWMTVWYLLMSPCFIAT